MKKSRYKFLFYIFLFVVFYLFQNVVIFNNFLPCFYGGFLALNFLGLNSFYLSLSYIASYIVNGVTLNDIMFCCILTLLSFCIKLIHKRINKPITNLFGILYCFTFGLVHLILFASSIKDFYFCIINIILNCGFYICLFSFNNIILARKFNFNLNTDEVIYFLIIVCMVFCGIQNVNIFIFDITKCLGVLFLLSVLKVYDDGFSIVFGVVCGIGALLSNGGLDYIAYFSICSSICFAFREQSKIYLVVISILCDVIFNFCFLNGSLTLFSFLPNLIACLVFLAIPNKFLNDLKVRITSSNGNSLKNMLNQEKMMVSKKLLYTSEIFYEMDKNFRKLIKGNLNVNDLKNLFVDEMMNHTCQVCKNREKCLKGFDLEIQKIFCDLIDIGFEKGKVTLVDLPSYLTNRCVNLNQIVHFINTNINDCKKFINKNENFDDGKILIAEQFGGISQILLKLSNEAKQNIAFDYRFEKDVKEKLIYNNIVPIEIVCYEDNSFINKVSIAIRKIDFDNKKICNILSKIYSTKMILDETFQSNEKNIIYLTYKNAPKYDISIGIAQTCKGGENICGDTHSASKLIGDKYMFAICDGMGHGDEANRVSDLSISLIENFYKAGFDNQTILTSVNKLLNINSEDVFSALDISVVDLKSGEIDFIKQGATIGFIKSGDEVNKIESNSLPLGILKDVSPKISKTVLSTEDIIFMMSDGIVDALGEEKIFELIKSISITNPQEIANKILLKAKLQQKNFPKDDMTVIVGKLYYNVA